MSAYGCWELASPLVELASFALDAGGRRRSRRVVGIDALVAPRLAPPCGRSERPADRLGPLDPGAVSLNAAARHALGLQAAASTPQSTGPGPSIRMQSGLALVEPTVSRSSDPGG